MLNEGAACGNLKSAFQGLILRTLEGLGQATPKVLEHAVFEAATGASRDDVDWDSEDNQAGYFTWLKAFEQLLIELEEDGYLATSERDGQAVLTLAERDDEIGWSRPGPAPRA